LKAKCDTLPIGSVVPDARSRRMRSVPACFASGFALFFLIAIMREPFANRNDMTSATLSFVPEPSARRCIERGMGFFAVRSFSCSFSGRLTKKAAHFESSENAGAAPRGIAWTVELSSSRTNRVGSPSFGTYA
jgi:hypothetical protein